jgi:ribose transport system permease protein
MTTSAARPVEPAGRSRFAWRTVAANGLNYGIVGVVVALFIALSISSDTFLSADNLRNIADQWAPVGIMAVGATVVVITGGFDLSVGAMSTVAGIVAAKATGTDMLLGIAAGLAVGTALGAANGSLVAWARMNPFLVTIATAIVFAGLALVISDGFLVGVKDSAYGDIALTKFLGLTIPVWLMIAFVLACVVLMNRTALGRYIYAVGGNEEAARLSGIRVGTVKATAYMLSGFAAGLAAVILTSRNLSAGASENASMTYDVWAAILVGGNSLSGGEGAIWRTVVGLMLIALLRNGFNLLGVDPLYQQIITGLIILAAVGLDVLARSRSARS